MSAVLESGQLEIRDIDKALFHLGNVYEDPRDALAEFITNGIDAGARQILVRLHRRGATGRIEVEDDGSGMTQLDLSRVAHSICDSIKAYDEKTVGEKGIGILGYQELAEECAIASKGEASPETNTLCLHRGRRDFEIVRSEGTARRVVPGTSVQLLRIDKQRMRQFSLAKVEDHLKKKFRMHLTRGDVRITIVEGKEARHIQPDSYKGVPFYVDQVRTPHGDVRLSLFVVPGGRSETVAVYHKGNLVVADITELDEFQGDPWASGKVAGEITNDFNKVTTGRTGFMHHRAKWAAWVNAIKGIEAQLAAEVDRLSQEATDEANRQMHKRIREAFLKALAELPAFGGITAPVADSAGEPTEGLVSPQTVLVELSEDEDGKDAKTKKRDKPVLEPSDQLTKARAGVGFNLIEEPFYSLPHLHSDFDARTVVIRVNNIHPDYVRETDSAERKESYLIRVIAKEMTLHEYPETDPQNLLEKLLDLELAARRCLAAAGRPRPF